MDMTLEIRPEPEFLNLRATGEFSLEEAKRTVLEMLEAVAESKATKVLFDGRKIKGEPATIERVYYGEFAAFSVSESSRLAGTKFGYVLLEPVRDPRKLGEMVAVNRGMLVKVFDNLGDALEWLEGAPANRPDSNE